MKLSVSCSLHFQIVEASVLILMLRPFKGIQQQIKRETYSITPETPLIESTDSFGNSLQRLKLPIGSFSIHTSTDVIVKNRLKAPKRKEFIEIHCLPNEVLPFLLPSRYCESDRFGDLARDITHQIQPGYDQVIKINTWVHDCIAYIPGSSDFPLSAIEVHQRGYGVCRDLAQVTIALCRSISIPSRLVVGYLHNLQPMDLHAWFEVYVGEQWHAFDPTQVSFENTRVIIAFGRDAADVPIFHQFGSGCLLNSMDVHVNLLDN